MTSFQQGDRVRVEMIGDDGLPLVRYGFVGGLIGDRGPVVVMFDGDLKNNTIVDLSEIEPVTITNVELRLQGVDLIDDPSLRQGLVNLWSAEAEEAGLSIGTLNCIGSGVRDSREGYALAELIAGGEQYVLRAIRESNGSEVVRVRADRPF
ncbi:MAG: hypothetical protein ACRDZZ_09725 [Ilumatobacteraceae bacterium]